MTHAAERHTLEMTPPPDRSGAGLPLANGLLGALLWADGTDLILSLDRTDLWDLRPVPEFSGENYTYEHLAALVDAGDQDAIVRRYEGPYRRPAPTKLPGGRLRVGVQADSASLTPYTGEAQAGVVQTCVLAEHAAGLVWGSGTAPRLVLEAPAYGQTPPERPPHPLTPHGPEDLDYPPPRIIQGAEQSGYAFSLPDGRGVCALCLWSEGEGWRAAWTIQIAENEGAAEARARAVLEPLTGQAADTALEQHRGWWRAHWDRAGIQVPDAVIERQWVLDAYKFGAAAREGAPPVALQGPWTLDNGLLPPWKGDYHHDLNTQMTYWPALTGNRLEAHRGFLDWLWDTRDACREWTRQFWRVDGLAVPMTADIDNRQLGGWAPYTHSATSGVWLAHHFAAHWRRSGDETFLRERAWPYMRETCVFIDELTARDAVDGRRKLRLSTSPEIGNNGLEAWFSDWTHYDLMLCRAALADAAEMAAVLGLDEEVRRWQKVLSELPEPAVDADGGFAIAPGVPLAASHRHFSHLMAVHPLRTVAPDDTRIAPSIARLEALGYAMWMGYTFSWMAGLYAYVGRGDDAARMLHAFARGFTGPNSFHTNGEVGPDKLTAFNFDAFTLEGNCAAMAAVQDMLLQSRGDTIDLFPAVPGDWQQASFVGLLADGGVEVSARLDGSTIEVTLTAPAASKRTLRAFGDRHEVTLQASEPTTIRLTGLSR